MPAGGPRVEEFARRMATLPGVIVETTVDAVTAGAAVLEDAARVNLTAATGGDLRLSRVRSGKGAKVDVQVRVKGAGRSATAVVVPTGPVKLVEAPTRPHVEPFQYKTDKYAMAGQFKRTGERAKRKRAKRKGFIWVPGVGARQMVNHPGTRGKQPIGKAFEQSGDRAGEEGIHVFQEAITKHLGKGA